MENQETLELIDVNDVKKNYTEFKKKFPGNRKHSRKLGKKVMSGWKKIILNHVNEMDDKEKVMTDYREKIEYIWNKMKKIKLWLKRKKDQVYLNWLDRVETMLSDEEKVLVERTEDVVYIDMLLSNEDKARI